MRSSGRDLAVAFPSLCSSAGLGKTLQVSESLKNAIQFVDVHLRRGTFASDLYQKSPIFLFADFQFSLDSFDPADVTMTLDPLPVASASPVMFLFQIAAGLKELA